MNSGNDDGVEYGDVGYVDPLPGIPAPPKPEPVGVFPLPELFPAILVPASLYI